MSALPPSRPLVEVCVDDAQGLRAAVAGGADRIELCSVLALGGLTPCPGLVALAGTCGVPVRAMIRPRPGDFLVDADEEAVMLHSIDAMRHAGLEGIVIGAATHERRLDTALLTRLIERAQGMAITLHRVIDVLDNQLEALDVAAALGIDTVLTSGGQATAMEGAGHLRRMVDHAAGRLTIMAGSGVTLDNARALVEKTGVRALHGSFSAACHDGVPDERGKALGFGDRPARRTSAQLVAEVQALFGPTIPA